MTRSPMRREHPSLFAALSRFLAVPIAALAVTLFVVELILGSPTELVHVSLGAFGVTATLAGLCSIAPATDLQGTHRRLRYAAEKYLHCCLLVLQVVIVAALVERFLKWPLLVANPRLHGLTKAVSRAILVLLAMPAVWCWWWATELLNAQLWENWSSRIDSINSAKREPDKSASPVSAGEPSPSDESKESA